MELEKILKLCQQEVNVIKGQLNLKFDNFHFNLYVSLAFENCEKYIIRHGNIDLKIIKTIVKRVMFLKNNINEKINMQNIRL